MYKRNLVKTLTLLLLVVTFSVNAQHEPATSTHEIQASSEKDLKTEIKEEIKHHVKDSYYFDFNSNSETGEYNGFSLPIILFDNGLHIFMSSKFAHGKKVAESEGNYYKLYHNKIYKTDAEGVLQFDEHHHPTNIKPLDFSITKTVVGIIIVSILVFWLFVSLAKSYAKNGAIPKGIGRFFEPLIIYIRDEIAIPSIGHKHYKKYMPFLLTVFFFVWFSNLIGITPFGLNVTGNLAVTAALAFLTFLITQFTSKSNYWKHIFWMPGVPIPMKIILAPIELLGVFIKPFALTLRLFANIFAGHMVIYSLLGLIFIFHNFIGGSLSFGLALVISVLELLVAILQAYIFTMLSALYFGMASEEHEMEHTE